MDSTQASVLCDELHALITDVAVCAGLSEVHRAGGDNQAVEGCRQTARAALDQIEVRLQTLRTLFQ